MLLGRAGRFRQLQFAVHLEGDMCAPRPLPGQERVGAVWRVENSAPRREEVRRWAVGRCLSAFLARHLVEGPLTLEQRHQGCFECEIGLADECAIALGFHCWSVAEPPQADLVRDVGKRVRQSKVIVNHPLTRPDDQPTAQQDRCEATLVRSTFSRRLSCGRSSESTG